MATPRARRRKGEALEARVALALTRLGYRNVETNVHFVDDEGHRSEVDVCARSPWSPPAWLLPRSWVWPHVIVECKNHAKSIPLEDVAKFREVARLLRFDNASRGIVQRMLWAERPLFVANGAYTPRARGVPGIRTLDRSELQAWERKAIATQRWRVGRRLVVLPLLAAGALVLGCSSERFGRPSAAELRERARERPAEWRHRERAVRAATAARDAARTAELRDLRRRGAAVASTRSGSSDGGAPLSLRARSAAISAKHVALGALHSAWARSPVLPSSALAARCDVCVAVDGMRRRFGLRVS